MLGQDHISATLRNALRTGKVAHAYLFSGPRGCGKTTSARILAKALNCTDLQDGEPCGVCESCRMVASGLSMDVIELDAASNNGVDAMRDLVSRASLGTAGRRKVYIVDEVHMLSTAASNALLKTLEEPPDHVVFVLATTDPQKVLPTIRSRTQHFEFRLFPFATLFELVKGVATDAGLELNDSTLEAVTRKGNGSARDALSALDQVAAAGGVEEGFDVSELTNALGTRDVLALLTGVERATDRGRDVRQLTRDLIESLREVFLVHMGMPRVGVDPVLVAAIGPAAATRALELLGEALVAMRDALDPRIVLETALMRLIRADLDASPGALVQRMEQIERMLSGPNPPSPFASTVASASAAEPDPRSAGSRASSVSPPRDDSNGPEADLRGPVASPAGPVASPPPSAKPSDLPSLPTLSGSSGSSPTLSGAPRRGGIADAARAVLGTSGRARTQNGVSNPTTADVAPGVGPIPPPTGSTAPKPSPRAHRGHPSVDTTADAAPGDAQISGRQTPVSSGEGARAANVVSVSDLLGDGRDEVFELLERRAKVMLSAGRFVRVSDDQVEFGLPNAMHMQRCDEWLPALIDATSAALGRSIAVTLVVDSSGPPGPPPHEADGEAPSPSGRRLVAVPALVEDPGFEPEEDIDLSTLADAKDATVGSTLERLTSAFPGAEIVDDTRR